jgi:hypothetical protein
MSKYIKPPKSKDCVWRSGPPPSIGWWPADHESLRNPRVIRWWDGVNWSFYAVDKETSAEAASCVDHLCAFPNKEIRWTDRWWEKK